jgi:acetylornithine deacetylase/succinyl-diaminopimelate desuccinylase-like protein
MPWGQADQGKKSRDPKAEQMRSLDALDQQFPRHLALLRDFVALPSVSTDSAYLAEMGKTAEFVAEQCRAAGLATEVRPTPGHPAVLAHNGWREGLPHLLVYGHYDVQPAEDASNWKHPPFEPTVEDGYLYGRGSSDNKGQILAHLCAMRCVYESDGELPVNLTVLVEGEEEVGSPNLSQVLRDIKSERPPFTIAMVSDTSTAVKGRPTVQYSLRGIMTAEFTLTTARREVHSGIFGGTTENAIRAMAQLLARVHDQDYRVAIPGFYDRVREPMDWEAAELESLPFEEGPYLEWIGASRPIGEAGFTTNQRRWFRPTLEFHGIGGGYQGEGSKTSVPCQAFAKLSVRLVPDQVPEEIEELVERWFIDNCPPGASIDYRRGHSGPAYLIGANEQERALLQMAKGVLRQAFEAEPILARHGGAIPILTPFEEILGVKTLLMGLGLPDDGVHSYDERFSLEQFRKGIRMSALMMDKLRHQPL